MKAGALQGSMSISADCFLGMTRFNNSSTLNGDSYLRPESIFDSTGGPVPATWEKSHFCLKKTLIDEPRSTRKNAKDENMLAVSVGLLCIM